MANVMPPRIREMVLVELERSGPVWRSSFSIGRDIGVEGHRVAAACTVLREARKLESRKIDRWTQWRPIEYRRPVSLEEQRIRRDLERLEAEQAGKSLRERRAW